MRLTGVLGTHFHPDHLGGQMGGWSLEGISTLLEKVQVPVHVQADEVPWVERTTGVGGSDLVGHHSGEVLRVGEVGVELIHTPGHTPGSQCFLVDGRLVAGDTLFLEGCGRTDFPGSDPLAMYESIHTRLARVPDDAILFPGHLYSADPSQSMGETRRWNYVFRPRSARGVDGHVRPVTTGGRPGGRRHHGGRHRRRRRRLARRMAGRRDVAQGGLRGDDLARRRGAAPSLRPAPALQAGAGRHVAAGEGGAGRQAALERAAGARGPGPPRRPARRGGAQGRARRRRGARRRRHRHRDRRHAAPVPRDRGPESSATACSPCGPSTTRSPCAAP